MKFIDIKQKLFNHVPAMLFTLLFSLILGLNSASAQDASDYGLFLNRQWKLLQFPTTPPSRRFPLAMADRNWLNAETNPMTKNILINRRYFQIAEELGQCLNPGKKVANWFHFATWASQSAGEVISGKKFSSSASYKKYFYQGYLSRRVSSSELQRDYEIDSAFQFANVAMNKTGISDWSVMDDYIDEQKVIFSETNYVIAAEMIPVGDMFLNQFCRGKVVDERLETEFFMLFGDDEHILKNAFLHYREAMLEKNPKLKVEKTLLGTIEQVFHEQGRVQKNLYRSLNSPLEPTGLLNSKLLTMSASFVFGDQGIRLHRDIRVATLAPELRTLTDPRLRSIFTGLKLSADRPGSTYLASACKDWSNLNCRKRFLAPLFRELLVGESELYAFSK
jgi:hypothetical protein